MWIRLIAAFVVLFLNPVLSNSGLSTNSFSNELRTGFARLFQTGIEQPLYNPFIILNPETQNNLIGQLRPGQNGPSSSTGFIAPIPRPRYHPPKPKRSNDVLVIVFKTANCSTNGTSPDDSDEESGNPDDDAEEVDVVTGGTDNGKEPSRCVWAILSCCAPANSPVRYTCFDVLGCSSAFWESNPCVPPVIKVALEEAVKYYGPITSFNRTMTSPSPAGDPPTDTDNMPVDINTKSAENSTTLQPSAS
ncbi:uncharacterized protein LOC126903608 isoform X2 [Daktulosphaira vitifoliae]|uniref:uncharacterized protein LOC126903608 isoform X2 n=1 Tax=Daktulosphaira vitifoliae TaxID=58002 RepID=UPI0021A9E312|nr:uncharacterized protein LOC126903608 isoform X2 [Daktulosphaira vitifoliae]